MSGEASRKIGRKQQETVEVFLLRQFRSFLPSRQTNRQLCELLNSHLRTHKWPIQEVYTLMTRHRSVHHTLRTLRIIVRFKVEIISTFQMATQKITETLYYTVTIMHIHNPCTNQIKILSKVWKLDKPFHIYKEAFSKSLSLVQEKKIISWPTTLESVKSIFGCLTGQ